MTSKYFKIPFANAGDKTTIPDASQPSGDVSFSDGYTPDYAKDQATDPDAKDVPRQSENYFKFTVTEALKEIQENGGKAYDPVVNYPIGARIQGSDNNIYKCIIANGPDSTPVVDPVGDVTGTWAQTGIVKTVELTTSGAYVKPPGLILVIVEVIGGGAGAGGVNGQGAATWAASSGGAAGGYSKKTIQASALSASETATIGAGGAGGNVGSGGGGGTTSLGSHLQATGGNGSGDEVGAAIRRISSVTIGGIGSLGDINTRGASGNPGIMLGEATSQTSSGNGGSSAISGGAESVQGDNAGNNADGYGAGGGGASTNDVSTDFSGGDGSAGIMIITEYY